MQPRTTGPGIPKQADTLEDDKGYQRMKHIARPDDLRDLVLLRQRLDDRLATRKQRETGHHQQDAEANILGAVDIGHMPDFRRTATSLQPDLLHGKRRDAVWKSDRPI